MKFSFIKFNDERFTEFCNEMAVSQFGAGVQPLDSPGPDLGRDAFLNGLSTYQGLTGEFIFQYKFHDVIRTGLSKARSTFKGEVITELNKIQANFPGTDHVFLFTSVELTSHFFKWLDDEIKPKYTFTTIQVWDHAKLTCLSNLSPLINKKYFDEESSKLSGLAERLEAALFASNEPLHQRVERIRSQIAPRDKFFRYEITTGEGEPLIDARAILVQAHYEADSERYVAISVFEKYEGALNDSPITGNLSLSFSNDEDGRTAQRDFARVFELGESVTVDSKYISEFETNDPISKFFPMSLANTVSITITPIVDAEIVHTTFEIVDGTGRTIASLPYMPLKLRRYGTKEIAVEVNDRQIPLKMELVVADGRLQISYSTRPVGLPAKQIFPYSEFIELLCKGGRFRVVNLITRVPLIDAPARKNVVTGAEGLAHIVRQLKKLEEALGIDIPFPEQEHITVGDVDTLDQLIKDGTIRYKTNQISLKTNLSTLANFAAIEDVPSNRFLIGPIDRPILLFNDSQTLNLGPCYQKFSGELFDGLDFEKRYHDALAAGEDEGILVENDLEKLVRIESEYVNLSGMMHPEAHREPGASGTQRG